MPYPDSEYPSILRGKDKRESQRLLAAAPDLLAALELYFRMDTSVVEFVDAARAAVIKATGGGER